MENEKLPIKFFAPREIDELRIEPGGNSDAPKWVLSGDALYEKARLLTASLDGIESLMETHVKSNAVVPFVFVAQTKEDATAKSKRKDISALFQIKESDSIIGLTATSKLLIRMDSIDELKQVGLRIKDCENHDYAISCLEHFDAFEPEIQMKEDEHNYKVKLIDYQDYEQNLAIRRLLERTLQQKHISFQKTRYSEEYYIYKLNNLTKSSLDNLASSDVYDAIFSIEPMPKYYLSLDSLDEEEAVPVSHPDKDKEYITIGILDNGIAPIPHLREWLKPERWSVYPETSINPTHGTFVAGIALYGDVFEKQNWVGHHGIQLFDAAVFPDTSKEGLDEDELIENIKEAIRLYHENVNMEFVD